MAYNTKMIKTDVNGKPIPQFYNPVTGEYEALEGNNGATRHILYGPTGDPITIVDNKMAVRATEMESILDSIDNKDFATETKQDTMIGYVDEIEARLDGIFNYVDYIRQNIIDIKTEQATSSAQNTINTNLLLIKSAMSTAAKQTTIESKLATLDAVVDEIAANIDLSATDFRDALRGASSKTLTDLATALGDLATLIGEKQDDPTANTMLARLKSLEDKIDAIVDGTAPAVTQLSGSNLVEILHAWNSTAINIDAGGQYESEIFERADYSFMRVIINFTHTVDATSNIEVWLNGKPEDLAFDGSAAGYGVEIPMITVSPSSAHGAKSVLMSDGDIPLYEYKYKLVIKNKKETNVELRNILIVKMR